MTELFDSTVYFGRKLPSPASARNCIGAIGQDFVGRVLGVRINPVDGRKEICPDFDSGEIKTIGKNLRGIVYKWRLEKDLKHHDQATFIYVFLCHSCPITVADAGQVAAHFRHNRPHLRVVTLGELAARLLPVETRKFHNLPEEELTSRMGWFREGYREGGWQFPLSWWPMSRQKARFTVWQSNRFPVRVCATDGAVSALLPYIGKMQTQYRA